MDALTLGSFLSNTVGNTGETGDINRLPLGVIINHLVKVSIPFNFMSLSSFSLWYNAWNFWAGKVNYYLMSMSLFILTAQSFAEPGAWRHIPRAFFNIRLIQAGPWLKLRFIVQPQLRGHSWMTSNKEGEGGKTFYDNRA